MPGIPTAMNAVVEALRSIGPMTSLELQDYLKRSISSVNDPLRNLRHKNLVYIKRYQPNHQGRQSPVYALGSKKDAKEKPVARKVTTKRYREKNSVKIAIKRNSNLIPSIWEGLKK